MQHYVVGSALGYHLALEMLEEKLAKLEDDNYSLYLVEAPVVTVIGSTVYILQKVQVQHEKPSEVRYYYTSPQTVPLNYDTVITADDLVKEFGANEPHRESRTNQA